MNRQLVVVAAVLSGVAGLASAAVFTPGNLAIVRLGGESTSSGVANSVFIDEYTTAGVFVQSFAMPTSTTGSNRKFALTRSATSEGALTLSADGQFLTMVGYDAAPSATGIIAASASTVNRVVARVDFSGLADTTTALDNSFNTQSPRSVVSTNGTDFWVSGGSSTGSNSGVRYTTLGSNASTQVNTGNTTNMTNGRHVNIFGGQLHFSSGSNNFLGVSSISPALATAAGATSSLLPGFTGVTGGGSTSAYDFYLNGSTLFIADDGSGGGLQKWVFASGSWSKVATYTTNLPAGAQIRQLTGITDGSGVTTIYATTQNTSGFSLVSLTDTGTPSFNVLANSTLAFRGIDFVPVPTPGSLALLSIGGLLAIRRRR